ncbi:MAG: hypothetical protein ACRDPB_02760 [Nocardioidaceae bacterium]
MFMVANRTWAGLVGEGVPVGVPVTGAVVGRSGELTPGVEGGCGDVLGPAGDPLEEHPASAASSSTAGIS